MRSDPLSNRTAQLAHLHLKATRIRDLALRMAAVQGQGYVGQALGVADILAVAYFAALDYRPADPAWAGRDRFLLSIGHYAIALYAALIAAGVLPESEVETYGADDSRLPMSGMAHCTPGMEISGGSLGHGLPIAIGMCLGLRRKASKSFVYVLLSDGELNEGATWEAALSASHWRLGNLIAIVDVNNQQADGPSSQMLAFEPLAEKWRAFGWWVTRVDGNDLDAVLGAFDAARALPDARPRIILCDTLMGKGVPFLETRDKTHFIRIEPEEWVARDRRPACGGRRMTRLRTDAMIASLGAEGQRVTAAPFGHTLARLAATRDDIVGMTADLGKYTDLHVFAAAHPDRFYQMGMAEQLLMASAAGMAREGFTPFVTTYAVFAARRAYDFIYMAIAEDGLDVKIACALPGLTTGYGPSHQATDDLAIFRAIPGLIVIDPCDAVDVEQATEAAANHRGPVYMRLLRGQVPRVLDAYPGRFEIGRARLLRDGADVLFITTGILTMRALEAAATLAGDRIDAGVLHMPTVKPLDLAALRDALHRPGRLVVVAENHAAPGGFGEAVLAQAALEGCAARLRQIALPDAFLDAGALPTLHDRYGISTKAVVERVKAWL